MNISHATIRANASAKVHPWHKLMLAGLMAAGLTACGGGSSEAEATAEEEAAAAAEDSASAADESASAATSSASTSSTDAADTYVGKWTRCKAYDGGESAFYVVINKKTGANTIRTTLSAKEYATDNCTGTSIGSVNASSDLTVKGTKVVSGKTVYKASIYQHANAYGPNPSKAIHWINGNRLYEGARGSTDGDGYPTSLDMANPWSRQ